MSYIVENLTRRPVTILCNSGKSYHLPPRFRKEFSQIEITNNKMVEKLKSRKVLAVIEPDEPAKPVEKKAKASATKKSAAKKETKSS